MLRFRYGMVYHGLRENVGSIGVKSALMLCVMPYIVPDLVKLFIAAVLSVRLGIYMK